MTWFVQLCTFLAVSAVVGLALWWSCSGDREITQRLDDLRDARSLAARKRVKRSRGAQNTAFSWLVQFGARLLPDSNAARAQLVERFMHAGIYSPAGPSIFAGLRFVAGIIIPMVVLLCGRVGFINDRVSLVVACVSGLTGFIGTGLWLRSRIAKRQRVLRKSLPDFLDLMGACMQAGQSFEAALARVTDELRTAHQALTFELLIVQREMTLGSTALRALRGFADRSGLDVVRQMSTLVDQSQRFGSSMTESLRLHSEMLRMQRAQQAETLAQKAGVKILFPTLLFIFPPVLIILAGPAVLELHEKFAQHSADSPSQSSR